MKGPWRNLYRVIGKTFFVWGFSFLHIKISRCAVTYICPRTREAQLCRGLGNRDRTRPPSACGCEATHLFVPFADGSLPAGTLRLPWAEGHPENRLLPCRPSFLGSSRRAPVQGQPGHRPPRREVQASPSHCRTVKDLAAKSPHGSQGYAE